MVISAFATVIASQALISGVFSLTSQAIALGLFPRIKIIHTNPDIEGQIYMPAVNWAMFVGCVVLVLGFKSSSALAAAYGIAVTGTMVITTLAFFFLAYYAWNWRLRFLLPICLFIILIDLSFFFSNIIKIAHGGWVPLIIASFVFAIMHTWEWGRKRVGVAYSSLPRLSVSEMIARKESDTGPTLNRSVVVLATRPVFSKSDKIPVSLDSFCHKWGVSVPKHIIFLNVTYANIPRVSTDGRCRIKHIYQSPEKGTITAIEVFYGYMQTPNLRRVIEKLKEKKVIKIPTSPDRWLILTSDLRFSTKPHRWINRVRSQLFGWIMKFAKPTYSFVGLDNDPNIAIETINI